MITLISNQPLFSSVFAKIWLAKISTRTVSNYFTPHLLIKYNFQQVVQKILRRMEDVHGMCERQRLSLQSAIATGHPAPTGPLRATHPNTHSGDGDKKRKDTVDTPQKPSSLYEKSARVSISYLDWLVGCFEDLCRFSRISAISRLGSRR